eukprot:4427634-Prymnesium_polylepis.3
MCPFDVPGSYLQGKQLPVEQIVCRPPVGFPRSTARPTAAPSGTAPGTTSSPSRASTASVLATSTRTSPRTRTSRCRSTWTTGGSTLIRPRTPCEEAAHDRERLTKEFGIEFKSTDPKNDDFLGVNPRGSDDRSRCTLTATTYIEDMGGRFLPGVDISKTSEALPAAWSYTPADETLVKA